MTSAAEVLATSIIKDLDIVAEELARETGLPLAVAFGAVFEEFMKVDREHGDGLLTTFIEGKLRAADEKRVVRVNVIH